MADIIAGIIIIGIGLTMGGSIFLGEISVLNLIFDGLGVFWICKGIKTIASKNAG
jgi:hypothetical protein